MSQVTFIASASKEGSTASVYSHYGQYFLKIARSGSNSTQDVAYANEELALKALSAFVLGEEVK